MWDDESWAWDQERSPGGCGRLKRERERVMRKRGRWEKRRRRREVVRRASRKPREVGGRKSEGSTAEAAGAPSGWISAAKRMSNKDGDREFNAAAEVKVNFPANRNTKKSSVSTKTCSFTTRFTVCLIKTQIQTDSSSWKHKSHMFGLKTFFFFFFHRKIKGPLLYTDRKTQNKSAQHRPRAHENQQNVKIHSHGRRIRCSFSRCSCFPRHVTSVRVPRSWPRAPRISHPGAFLIRCLKKSQDIQQDSIWLELSSCQPKLYPGVSCCCWRRRTPLCDCRKWRAVKRAQISAERSCSSLKRRHGVKFKFPPWMPKVFFKSSLLQCYITVCGKHRAAEKRRSRGGSCSTKPRPAGSYTFLFLISFLPLPSETKGHFIRLVMICISVSLSANPMKALKRTVNRSS